MLESPPSYRKNNYLFFLSSSSLSSSSSPDIIISHHIFSSFIIIIIIITPPPYSSLCCVLQWCVPSSTRCHSRSLREILHSIEAYLHLCRSRQPKMNRLRAFSGAVRPKTTGQRSGRTNDGDDTSDRAPPMDDP